MVDSGQGGDGKVMDTGFLLGDDENILKSIVVVAAQFCQYIKTSNCTLQTGDLHGM